MPAIVCDSPCHICGARLSVMHDHHVIPQSCGGENGPRVILCADHHNILHAHALHISSAMRRGKTPKPKEFWERAEYEERARPLVEAIVKAFIAENRDGRHIVTLELSTAELQLLKLLQRDLGKTIASSQEKTLMY